MRFLQRKRKRGVKKRSDVSRESIDVHVKSKAFSVSRNIDRLLHICSFCR